VLSHPDDDLVPLAQTMEQTSSPLRRLQLQRSLVRGQEHASTRGVDGDAVCRLLDRLEALHDPGRDVKELDQAEEFCSPVVSIL
jgi:hypothetical protein